MEPQTENRNEHFANVTTHAIGLGLSCGGAAALIVASVWRGSAWHVVASSIFAASLILLYSSSTLYHAFSTSRLQRIFRALDHSAIYVLIAGTYTPFTLVSLRGAWGWSLFGVLWGLAVGGVVLKIFAVGHFPGLSTSIYILMGWLGVIALKPLLTAVPRTGLLWLLAGGVLYTGGVVFYLAKRLPYHHAVWHLFVLGGSICHYGAVFFYVLPGHPA